VATVVEFECPICSTGCSAHSRPGEVVRCPHCFSFVAVPGDELPQLKAAKGGAEFDPVSEPDSESEAESEPATIVFRCQYCQSRMETDVANAGLPCLCPGCRASMIVPGYAQPIFLPRASRREPEMPRPQPKRDHVATGIILAMLALLVGWIVVNWLRVWM